MSMACHLFSSPYYGAIRPWVAAEKIRAASFVAWLFDLSLAAAFRILFEQKLSSPCPGKWLERDVPPMLRCEFVRC